MGAYRLRSSSFKTAIGPVCASFPSGWASQVSMGVVHGLNYGVGGSRLYLGTESYF